MATRERLEGAVASAQIKKERAQASLDRLITDGNALLKKVEYVDNTSTEGIAYDIADTAIYVYRAKIAAALRRAGLEIGDEEDLNSGVILDAVRFKTGLNLQSFDVEEIKTAVIRSLSTAITERLGFEVDLKDGIEAAIENSAEAAIAAGGRKLISLGQKALLNRMALANRAGVGLDVVNKVYAAKRQAEWRKNAPPAYWVSR